jgi:hypothetical protein
MWFPVVTAIFALVLRPVAVRIQNSARCPVHVSVVDGARRLKEVYVESQRTQDVGLSVHTGSTLRFVVTPGAGCGFARFEVNGYFEAGDTQLLVTVGDGQLLSKVARFRE